jgi:hypothetical protein
MLIRFVHMLSGLGIALLLWCIAVIIIGYGFMNTGQAVAGEGVDLEVPFRFLSLPVFVGFRHNGLHGMHVQWGLVVMLLAPALVGLIVSLYILRTARRR